MQPTASDLELVHSFEELVQNVLAAAAETQQEQQALSHFLRKHQHLLSARFRTAYLQGRLSELVRELRRTCRLAEDNVELLDGLVEHIGRPELVRSLKRHKALVARKTGKPLSFGTHKDAHIINVLKEELGSNWFKFSHNIGIPDRIVDEIEMQFKEEEHVDEVIFWVCHNVEEDRRLSKILEALKLSDRTDLAEKIQLVLKLNN